MTSAACVGRPFRAGRTRISPRYGLTRLLPSRAAWRLNGFRDGPLPIFRRRDRLRDGSLTIRPVREDLWTPVPRRPMEYAKHCLRAIVFARRTVGFG